ncbi:MAG: hypothetical protein IJI33_05225 [Solobacterium sp.]|nr:hypothetical protein [Solobacterium sp.]MBQ6356841.1 hypothetical protein [Solobacterium sp.]MBQ6532382.1 hypothetical protein [Solobacterium sp.]MBR0214962.1 hypothetical protein [Solobacterium sp.]
MENIRVIYLAIAAIIVMAVIIARDQKKKYDDLKGFIERSGKHFEVIECSQNWLLQNAWIIGLCVVLAVYIGLVPSSVGGPSEALYYILAAGLMGAVGLGYLLSEKTFQNLYVSRESFYHSGKSYRFTSVRDIVPDRRAYKVHMMNGETLSVSRDKAMAIQAQVDRKPRKIK